MPSPARGTPAGDHAAARGARRPARRLRVRAVRDRLLPPVVPAGAVRRGLRRQGAREPRAQGADRGAARRHRRPRRARAGQDARRAGGADRPRARCPSPSSTQADEFRKARSAAEQDRLAAAVAAARARARHPRAPPRADRAASAASAAGSPRAARQARPVAIPPVPADELKLRRLYRRLGRVIRVKPRRIHQRVIEGVAELPYSNVTIKTAVSRAAFNYIRERKEQFPGVAVEKQYLRDYPHKELAAQLFGTTREISPAELKEKRYRGVEPGTRIGADGLEEKLRQVPARQGRLHARSSSTRSATATTGGRRSAWSRARASGCGSRSTSTSSARPTTRSSAASRPRRRTAPRRARSWRWTRATARCSRSAPTRASTPTSSPSRSRRSATTR